MNNLLEKIKVDVYDKLGLEPLNFQVEAESKEYAACRFELNQRRIICRSAKITPKKVGQFVTFWKRNGIGPIEPFHENDAIDYFVVNLRSGDEIGQFVFPKSILIKKGIISTEQKEGKRAFRVYPKWDFPKSKQAERTQRWQLEYFYEVHDSIDTSTVLELYR